MDKPVLLLKNNFGIKTDIILFTLENSIIKVGRDNTAELSIPDPFISRLQAELYFENDNWFIRDLQSKNGTYVNEAKIGSQPVKLNDGDVISFSKKIEFLYKCKEPESAETLTISTTENPYGIEMNEKTEEVIVDGIKINPRLGQQEWKFLSLLYAEPDRIHTYKELAQQMYMVEEDIFALPTFTKSLQMIKNDIVRKFKKQGITREVIKSRSGVGYQLVEKYPGKEI